MNIKKFLLPVFLSLLCLYSAAQSLPEPEADKTYIRFSSQEMNYDAAARTLALDGSVNIMLFDPQQGNVFIRSDSVYVDQNYKKVVAPGRVNIITDYGTIEGENLQGGYSDNSLSMENITASVPPIRILGAKKVETKNGKQKYKGAQITCCDEPAPHYSIYAGGISMNENKKVFGYNGILYLNDLPVFYVPVFWRSLDSKKPFTTYVDFTQGTHTGFGLLTSTVFEPIKGLDAIINADYYTRSGIGVGGQLTVEDRQDLKLNVEAYGINDKEEDKERWGIKGGMWWKMLDTSDSLSKNNGAIYQSQVQFRAVSDPYFNNIFFRSNPYMFMPDQDVSVAASRQSRTGILRVSYLQKNIFSKEDDKFVVVEQTLPKLEYQLMPFTLKGTGIVSSMQLDAYNTEEYSDGYNQTAHFNWRSSRPFKLNKVQTLTPTAFFDQSVTFKDSAYDDKDAWISRVGGGANLRTELATGSLDITYNYEKRLSTGTLKSDTDSFDKGEEVNQIYIQNYYRPSPYTYFKIGTGYNIKDSEDTWQYSTRMEPLLAEIGINTPGNGFNFYAQNLYKVGEGNEAFIFNSDFKLRGNSRLMLGMTNYTDDDDAFTFQTRLTLSPKKSTWLLSVWGEFEISRRSNFDLFSKGLRLHKTFHDATIMVGVEEKNENLSFDFRINILCGAKSRKELHTIEDEYWNPWREPGSLRD